MIVPRRQVPAIERYTSGVPWVARERSPVSMSGRVMARLLATLLLTLAFSAIAAAQERATAVPAPADVVPVVNASAPAPTPAAAAAPASRREAAAKDVPSAPAPAAIEAPADLRDVQAWVAYKQARHLAALPVEARLFYRRGLTARMSGQTEAAMRDVRGASELDPAFVEPHLTIASWQLVRDPSQALLQYASVLDLLRQDFNLQLDLAANLTMLLLQSLFAGLLVAGLLVVWLRREELLHTWHEELSQHISSATAMWWAYAFLLLPFVAGFGLTLPTLMFLGLMWPTLRVRERTLFVMLALAVGAMPLALRGVERMSLPLDGAGAPFFGVPTLENEPYSPDRHARLAAAAADHPNDPFVQFGLGWSSRRGRDLTTAERAYRDALRVWPDHGRVLNNLGNVLAVQGRTEEALAIYQKAGTVDPENAAAWFNASQLYTQRFEYQQATEALTKASAIQFELVKNYQSKTTDDGLLPLVDQWLEPALFWRALWAAPLASDLRGSIPMSLRSHLETSGWGFSIFALLLAIASVYAGHWQMRRLPLRSCSNCGRIVCRRCAQRRREHALCPACAQVEAQAETTDFSRVLLLQSRNRQHRRMHLFRTAIAAIVPGYGLLAHRRVFTPILLLGTTWVLTRVWTGYAPPFAIEPRLTLPGEEVPVVLVLGLLGIVYTVSLLGYFHHVAKEREREAALAAGQRGRITQSTRRVSAMAA